MHNPYYKKDKNRNPSNPYALNPFKQNKQQPEIKCLDDGAQSFLINTNSSNFFTLLNAITEGDDINNRIGRKITMIKFEARGMICLNASLNNLSSLVQNQTARIIVFYDKQHNGGAPTLSGTAATDILNGSDPSNFLNLNCRNRYLIIDDQYFNFDSYEYDAINHMSAYGSKQSYPWIVSKKLNLDTIYNSTHNPTDHTDINSGALYLLTLGSGSHTNSCDLIMIASLRLRFTDA